MKCQEQTFSGSTNHDHRHHLLVGAPHLLTALHTNVNQSKGVGEEGGRNRSKQANFGLGGVGTVRFIIWLGDLELEMRCGKRFVDPLDGLTTMPYIFVGDGREGMLLLL